MLSNLFWLAVAIACGYFSMGLIKGRGGNSIAGFLLGFLLGPIGLAIAYFFRDAIAQAVPAKGRD